MNAIVIELYLGHGRQIIDCSGGYGNEQCAGGSHMASYAYLTEVKGLQSAQSYPPSRNLTGPCTYVASQA
jgi:hypothetical protein